MATVKQVRDGIAAALTSVTVLGQSSPLDTYARMPGQLIPPAAVVRRASTTYDVTFDSKDDNTYAVELYVPFNDPDYAQEMLDALLAPSGSGSVRAAIEASPTLAGIVDFVQVVGATEDGLVTLGDAVTCLSATVNLTVGT